MPTRLKYIHMIMSTNINNKLILGHKFSEIIKISLHSKVIQKAHLNSIDRQGSIIHNFNNSNIPVNPTL